MATFDENLSKLIRWKIINFIIILNILSESEYLIGSGI